MSNGACLEIWIKAVMHMDPFHLADELMIIGGYSDDNKLVNSEIISITFSLRFTF